MTAPSKFSPHKTYLLTGRTLNQIVRAIRERTPLAGHGLQGQQTPQGVILRAM